VKYFILISILFSQFSWALESVDKMTTQIIKVYEKNILVLNRGAEDGIFREDHIKITSPNGFIARGICVGSSMQLSHWKIYRVVRPELVSKDVEYNLVAIPQSERPNDFKNLTDKVDFTPYLNDKMLPDEKKQIARQQKRIIYYDLPKEAVMKLENIQTEEKESFYKKFVKENISNEKLKQDFSELFFEINASPYITQTRNDQREFAYGLKLYNKAQKYRFRLEYQQNEKSYTDPVSEKSYKQNATRYYVDFSLNRFTNHFSTITSIENFSEKIGTINYPQNYYKIIPLGIKYNSNKNDNAEDYAEIIIAPVFDQMEYDSASGETESREGIRALLSIALFSKVNEKINLNALLEYAPFYDATKSKWDYSDTNSKIQGRFSYMMSSNFFIDYSLEYQEDTFRAQEYGISNDNTTQSLNFNFLVSL